MAPRLIDISIPLKNDVPTDPPQQKVSIRYRAHGETAGEIASFFPGLKKEQLPDGEGWRVETVEISTHNRTHVDAQLALSFAATAA
jgi:kynurenine formamidase